MPRGVYERKPKDKKRKRWSKSAREKQSVRLKAYHRAKNGGGVVAVSEPTVKEKKTIKARLLKVVADAQAIIADLG